PAELLALVGVLRGFVHDSACTARRSGGETEPAGVEYLECYVESLAYFSEHVADGDAHLFERDSARVGGLDAHLLLGLAERDAVAVRIDDECGDAIPDVAVGHHGHLRE